jgi:hypothetical protein
MGVQDLDLLCILGVPKGLIEQVGKYNPLYMQGSHQISGYPPHNALGEFQRGYCIREALDRWVRSRPSRYLGSTKGGLLNRWVSPTHHIRGNPTKYQGTPQ